jgi:hypothetical protein
MFPPDTGMDADFSATMPPRTRFVNTHYNANECCASKAREQLPADV